MIPAIYNLPTGYRGDTYGPIIFTFTDKSGAPVMLDGYGALSEWRNKKTNELVLSWSTENNTLSTSGNSLIMNTRCAEDMDINASTYVYDIQFYSGQCFIKTYIRGEVVINQDVSNLNG